MSLDFRIALLFLRVSARDFFCLVAWFYAVACKQDDVFVSGGSVKALFVIHAGRYNVDAE